MNPQTLYELIGYLASILVAASLTMRSILRLRLINLIGALFFTAYGLLIRAYPVAAVNAFIALINIYFLLQIFLSKEYFTLLEVRPDSAYLKEFLRFYEKDIQRFLPAFRPAYAPHELVIFVLRNMVPAGLVIGERLDEHRLQVRLDYAIPGYRDLKVGRYVFVEQKDALRQKGFRHVLSPAGTPQHARYLRRMGFLPTPNPAEYRLDLEETPYGPA
jgi:hypothetical protein